jgi:hypothetical protein
MWMTNADTKWFPNLLHVVRDLIPLVQSRTSLVDLLSKWSEREKALIKASLRFGEDPKVKVVDHGKILPGVRIELGSTPNNSPTTKLIEINAHLVRFLELVPPEFFAGKSIDRSFFTPGRTRIARQLEEAVRITLLHELVHFGENEVGAPDLFDSSGAPIERGFAFEDDAKLVTIIPPELFRVQKIEDSFLPFFRDPQRPFTSNEALLRG